MLNDLQRYETNVSRSIKPQEGRGMIQVLGRKLQTRLQSKVKEEQHNVRVYLAELADKQAKEVALGLTQIRADMGKKPSSLPSYIDFVQRLDECNKIKDSLSERKKGLEEIKTVLTKFRPKDEGYQSLPLQGRIDQLTIDIENTEYELHKALEDAHKEREGHVEDLEKRLFEEQEKVKLLIEDVQTNEKLTRAETTSKEALDTAVRIRKKYDESVRKLNQYLGYQDVLKLPKSKIEEMEIFESTYNIRHQIWQIRHSFAEQEQRWYRDNFREQDAQLIV
jgi:hypothetical protein